MSNAVGVIFWGGFIIIRDGVRLFIANLSNSIWSAVTDVMLWVAMPTVTLWILLNGYQVMVGNSKESISAYGIKAVKVLFLMTLATGNALFNGTGTLQQMVLDLRDVAASVMTLGSGNIWDTLQSQAMALGAALAGVDAAAGIISDSTPSEAGDTGRTVAALGATIGVMAPMLVVSLTALTLEAGMLIGLSLGPIFFFLGIFQRFADFPLTWAKYMFTMVFTGALMAALGTISFGLLIAFMATAVIQYAAGAGLVQIASTMSAAGIFLSVLMFSIPAIVGRLFGGAGGSVASDQAGAGGGANAGTSRGKADDIRGGYRTQAGTTTAKSSGGKQG
jgi:type IV secretion system protein VirB6